MCVEMCLVSLYTVNYLDCHCWNCFDEEFVEIVQGFQEQFLENQLMTTALKSLLCDKCRFLAHLLDHRSAWDLEVVSGHGWLWVCCNESFCSVCKDEDLKVRAKIRCIFKTSVHRVSSYFTIDNPVNWILEHGWRWDDHKHCTFKEQKFLK